MSIIYESQVRKQAEQWPRVTWTDGGQWEDWKSHPLLPNRGSFSGKNRLLVGSLKPEKKITAKSSWFVVPSLPVVGGLKGGARAPSRCAVWDMDTSSRTEVAPYLCLLEDVSTGATWHEGVLLPKPVVFFFLGQAG